MLILQSYNKDLLESRRQFVSDGDESAMNQKRRRQGRKCASVYP